MQSFALLFLILFDKIKLMERRFGLETFVRASAKRAAETLQL